MKGKLYFFLTLFFLVPLLDASEFVIRYQTLSCGTVYHIETKMGQRLGKIVRDCSSSCNLPVISSEQEGEIEPATQKERIFYSLLDVEEKLLARGETKINERQTQFTFMNATGEVIGSFTAQILNLYPTEYHIFSADHQLIAKGYMNWLGNYFVLTHPENSRHLLATFSRPMFKLFNDNWHFQIHEEGKIDFSLLCVIGAFQTACDLRFEMVKPKS